MLISLHWLWLAVFKPWKLVNATIEAFFPLVRSWLLNIYQHTPDLRLHSSVEPTILLVLSGLHCLFPSSQGAFESCPYLLFVCTSGEILVLCCQKSKQQTVYLYRDFLLFAVISHAFLHFGLCHNPERDRRLSNWQMANSGSGGLHGNDGAR